MGLADNIQKTYAQAAKEVKKKLDEYTKHYQAQIAVMQKRLESGKISQEDYNDWLERQIFRGKRWQEKLDDITKTYVDADGTARELVGDRSKNVFARFANSTARDIQNRFNGGVSFDMYDRHAVERLLKENPQMLPEWKINEKKDYRWNAQRVQNAIAQGIIQGESIPQLTKRLTSELSAGSAKHMTLFARTAMTGAQNAGRVERLHEAQDMGIVVKKKWLAAHDDRVRDAHAELDGQEVGIDEPFHSSLGDIMYPGDPTADPANVYNCRCTLTYVYDVQASRENLQEKALEDIEIPHSKLHPETSYATHYFAGVVDEDNDYRARIAGRDYELRDVRISELYTDQATNSVEDIRRMLRLKIDEPVVVVHVDGKDILLDGNTRSAAASLKGQQTITAKYYNLDEVQNAHVELTSIIPDEIQTKGYVGLSGEQSDEFMQMHHNRRIIGRRGSNTMEGKQSRRINSALRKGEMPTESADIKLMRVLDSEINKNELPQDMTLFRGVGLDAFEDSKVFDGFRETTVSMSDFKRANGSIDYDAWNKAYEAAVEKDLAEKLSRARKLIGETIEDKGYMQVSASSQRSAFAASKIGMQIHASKGTHAYISDYLGESEIILQRGTRFKIVGATIAEVVLQNGNRVKTIQLIVELLN